MNHGNAQKMGMGFRYSDDMNGSHHGGDGIQNSDELWGSDLAFFILDVFLSLIKPCACVFDIWNDIE